MKILDGTITETIMYGVFFMSWFMPESIYLDLGVIIRPIDVAAAMCILALSLDQLSRGKLRYYNDNTIYIICAMILWGALSVLWAEHKRAVFPELVQWVELLFLFLTMSMFLKTEEHLSQFIMVFLVLASIQQVLQGPYSLATFLHAIPYTRERADPLCSVFLIVYLCASLAEHQTIFRPTVTVSLILLSGLNLFFSLTRTGIIGCALCLGTVIVLTSRSTFRLIFRSGIFLAVVAAILLVFNVTSPGLWDQLSSRFEALTLQGEDLGPGVEGRLTHIAISYKIFKAHPFVGIGLGNHALEFRKYFVRVFEKTTVENIAGVHNGFLFVLSELGLIGFIILLFLFFKSFRLIRFYKKYAHKVQYPALLLGSASMNLFVMLKFGTTHAGIGRTFPLIFLLVLTNAYERFLGVTKKTARSEEQRGKDDKRLSYFNDEYRNNTPGL